MWGVKCDVALPCATQNELLLDDARTLAANGALAVVEGANMPTSIEATKYLQERGVLFVPGKASNAGGVAVSGLECRRTAAALPGPSGRLTQSSEHMVNIYHKIEAAAAKYGMEGNYVAGANITGFEKVVSAMTAHGAC